jgi:hypothetical protein
MLDKQELTLIINVLDKIQTKPPDFGQKLKAYLISVKDAPDKPAWINNNPDSASISALLTDDSNL